MFLSAILLALLVGALAGGGLPRLAELRLRWFPLLGIALALRLGAQVLRQTDVGPDLPLGLAYIVAYLLIFAWLWGNWRVPGLQIAAVGIASNALAVLMNGGQMPVWSGAFEAAGFRPDVIANDPFHYLLVTDTVAQFVGGGGLFGDVIPIPLPIIRDVVSVGDLLLAMGIFLAIVFSMVRPDAPIRRAFTFMPATIRPATAGGLQASLGYSGVAAGVAAFPGAPRAIEAPAAEGAPRAQSPYLRLAANRDFSLLWMGQLISLFGERIHVVALAFLVAQRGTPLEVGLTFAASAVPNVILGPLAGALVDRWDRRTTMIGCDVVRAGLVLLVPFAIEISIGLVYVVAFAIATVTLLFRPAKTAVIPLVVEERDLVTANSANSISETAADLIGYPVAGVIVAALSGVIGAAFVLDAGTYVISAILIWAMVVPPDPDATATPFSVTAVWREMAEGWSFLRHQSELFANTIVSTIAQIAFGAEIVVSLLYAKSVLVQDAIPYPLNYSLILAAIAFGSLAGGVSLGALGSRLPKGPIIIAGFIVLGLTLVAAGFVTDPYLAIAIFFLTGAANMLFLIPTITLFQERTPQRLMGRVVSTRQALVFGVMAASMAASGWLADIIGPAPVLAAGGLICALAGLAGAFVPAMRNAR